MAECLNSKQEVDTVKCGICLSHFTKPVLLGCFHIFCTPCVTKLAEGKDTLICPLCRAEHALPENGVDSLTLYPYMQNIEPPEMNSTILCQMCDNHTIVVSNCIDCKSKMCLECSSYHLKHKLFKTHKTENIVNECFEIKSPDTLVEDDTCETHKEELSFFCEPCNRAICKECVTQSHKFHKSEPIIFQAQRRRDLLRSAISAIKSKITAIDQEREMSKFAENNHYKLCRQWKAEVRTYAKRSKETFCKIIDVLADTNLQTIDEMQTQDIKSINNFQDELETKNLSLHCLLRSTEDIVNRSCHGKLLNRYAFLYQTVSNAVTQDKQLKVFAPQFCFGHQIEHKYIEKCFGLVKRGEQPSIIGASESHMYSLPTISKVTELTKIRQFPLNDFRGFVGVCDDKTWILHQGAFSIGYVKLYSAKCSDPRNQVQTNNVQQILRATQNELWVKSGEFIKKITTGTTTKTDDIVSFNELANTTCYLADDNRVVAYSVNRKCFYEVNINGDWPVTINETTLKTIPAEKKLVNLITTGPFRIIETLSKNFILTCKENVVTVDRKFRMCNVYEKKSSEFKGMCGDPYGNIYIVDFRTDKLFLFNSSGEHVYTVSAPGISYPIDITRDSVGNIWLFDNDKCVHVFSCNF